MAILRYARGPYQPSSSPPTYDYGIPQGVVSNDILALVNIYMQKGIRLTVNRDEVFCILLFVNNFYHSRKYLLNFKNKLKKFSLVV